MSYEENAKSKHVGFALGEDDSGFFLYISLFSSLARLTAGSATAT